MVGYCQKLVNPEASQNRNRTPPPVPWQQVPGKYQPNTRFYKNGLQLIWFQTDPPTLPKNKKRKDRVTLVGNTNLETKMVPKTQDRARGWPLSYGKGLFYSKGFQKVNLLFLPVGN